MNEFSGIIGELGIRRQRRQTASPGKGTVPRPMGESKFANFCAWSGPIFDAAGLRGNSFPCIGHILPLAAFGAEVRSTLMTAPRVRIRSAPKPEMSIRAADVVGQLPGHATAGLSPYREASAYPWVAAVLISSSATILALANISRTGGPRPHELFQGRTAAVYQFLNLFLAQGSR